MKIVKVTYTVKQDFAEQNAANIRNMMQDLQAAPRFPQNRRS